MEQFEILRAPLAQLVEQLIYTEKVGGSSPSGRTGDTAGNFPS